MAAFHKHARSTRRSGSVAIEYALILPALLLLIIGIIDVSRLLWTYTTLYRATEAAARCAAINSTDCGTTATIQTYAVSQAFGLQITTSAFTVSTPSCGVQVGGSYNFTFAIPAFGTPMGTVVLNATACYPLALSGGGSSSSVSGGHED